MLWFIKKSWRVVVSPLYITGLLLLTVSLLLTRGTAITNKVLRELSIVLNKYLK